MAINLDLMRKKLGVSQNNGKEQDNTSNMRFLNISKNKLLGDSDTLPDLRHGNAQVMIKPDIARYNEI